MLSCFQNFPDFWFHSLIETWISFASDGQERYSDEPEYKTQKAKGLFYDCVFMDIIAFMGNVRAVASGGAKIYTNVTNDIKIDN